MTSSCGTPSGAPAAPTAPDTTRPGYFSSGCKVDIASDNIVSYALGRPDCIDPSTKIWVDALDDTKFVTYQQAATSIRKLATGLKAHGLEDGDTVCIHSFNKIYYPLLWLGGIAAGGIVTGSNPAYTTAELIHHFKTTQAKFLFVHNDCYRAAVEAAQECDISPSNIFSLEGGESTDLKSFSSWETLLEDGPEEVGLPAGSDVKVQPSRTAAYASTSGTTGLPKAAEISHRYLVAQSTIISDRAHGRDNISQIQCLPIFHAFAAPVTVIIPLRLGITTYLMPRFKLDDYVNAVDRFQVTDTAVVPPIAVALRDLEPSRHPQLSSLRYVVSAGAPMSANVQNSFRDIFSPGTIISQCWGCTELGWMTLTRSDECDTTGSVGLPLANVVVKLKDDDGNVITQDGVRGEAFVWSSSMFSGYVATHNKDVNKGLFDDEGFYGTGDLAYIKDGRIYIDGRAKDIMKVNGWQVSPQELQSVIMQCEDRGVADCVVVGHNITNEKGLEVTLPRAYVVKKSDAAITKQEIKQYVKSKLVSYKQLTGGVYFVDKIARTPTGKIERRTFAKLAADVIRAERKDDDEKLSKIPPPVPNLEEQQQQPIKEEFGWGYYAFASVFLPICFVCGPLGIILVAGMVGERARRGGR